MNDHFLDTLLSFCQNHPAIDAVILTSTRVRNLTIDALSDYDIEIYTSNPEIFITSDTWMQFYDQPMFRFNDQFIQHDIELYMRMVIYEDYTKVDYKIIPTELLEKLSNTYDPDLDNDYQVLIDKGRFTENLLEATHQSYYIKAPEKRQFDDMIGSFFMECSYIAKNLWRQQLMEAKYSFAFMRFEKLLPMLEWYLAAKSNTPLKHFKHGRNIEQYLSKTEIEQLNATYAAANYEENWQALYAAIELFAYAARKLNYQYPEKLHQKAMKYFTDIQNMERDRT
ncbi:aminoglycoside 6-adenylyltransferase [Culicoidibacter larvae]|uniref:Aminoglycoside 6-adenylyltransferase n=1 Tax=Culicoidibacter larvae TaxID=2579976 RepID=A0A5R8QBU4_9FIRM|nr:aminoglycoside 6-adenylyltransferase [Culicoidibacter larvae]TLG73804.1 hypothetical protein FEZ08_06630 [Culicoidibacter larvae]